MKNTFRMAMLGAVMAGVLLPVTNADAAKSPAEKKEQRFLNQLKRLPNGASPPARVKRPTLKLARLNPNKAARFYKIATLKYAEAFVQRKAQFLANQVRRIVSQRLARAKARRINNRVTKIERRVVVPVPTPTPYQAWNRSVPEMVA